MALSFTSFHKCTYYELNCTPQNSYVQALTVVRAVFSFTEVIKVKGYHKWCPYKKWKTTRKKGQDAMRRDKRSFRRNQITTNLILGY
jgi:hypothetical protein